MENTEKTIDDINEEINQEIQKTKGKDSEVELEITENTEEKPKEVDKDTLSEEDKKQYSINVQNRIKKLISEKIFLPVR